MSSISRFNTLRPRQKGCYFPDDIFKCIFLLENIWISIKISLKFVPMCLINNIPALVQIMAWCGPATSCYLNQWWLDYRCIYALLGLNDLTLATLKSFIVEDMNQFIQQSYWWPGDARSQGISSDGIDLVLWHSNLSTRWVNVQQKKNIKEIV